VIIRQIQKITQTDLKRKSCTQQAAAPLEFKV